VISAFLLACVLACGFYFGYVLNLNSTAIDNQVASMYCDSQITECLFDADITLGPNMCIRETISDALNPDMHIAALGEHFVLDDVEFLVAPSNVVVHSMDAPASVDVAIRNNSLTTLKIPLQHAWKVLCPQGQQLQYHWNGWEDIYSTPCDSLIGIIGPGQTYLVSLFFTDAAGAVADAVVVSAELSRPLAGKNRIYWIAE